MKLFVSSFVLLVAFNCTLSAQDNDAVEFDKDAIKELVEQFYVDVVFGSKDLEELKQGFHNEFNMYVLHNNQIDKRTLQQWVARLEQVRSTNTQIKKPRYTHQVKLVDVTGSTGVIKIEVYADGKIKYTDYLSLYKFKDGWKIMTKLFSQHD